MNYTIPKDRQQAIEIYNELMNKYDSQLVDSIPTKYYMFIGALTECSDREFQDKTRSDEYIVCELCTYKDNADSCREKDCSFATRELFSKRWNE